MWRLAFALVACAEPPGDTELPPPEDDLRYEVGEARTGGDGLLALEVVVEAGETSLMVTVDPEPATLARFVRVTDPSGAVVFDADEEVDATRLWTIAHLLNPVVSFTWPRLDSDGPLLPGTWTLLIQTGARGDIWPDVVPEPDRDVDLHTFVKTDADLGSGELAIAIVLAGAAADDADLVEALDPAVDELAAIFGAGGVDVALTWHTWPTVDFGHPLGDDIEAYASIALSTPEWAIPVIIVPAVEPFTYSAGVSPLLGPLVPTESSGLLVVPRSPGVGPTTGPFSADESALVGRIMAHELGHYLGLFHTVEVAGDFGSPFDALDDTPECSGYEDCVQQSWTNVMFPIGCGADCQRELSPQQVQVFQHHPATR